MQSRKILLAIGLAAIVFGISGYLPTAHAAQLQLNETNCTDFLFGSWSGDTCTITGDAEIGFEEDEETPNVLIISGPTTLELLAGSSLSVTGGIDSLGTIDNSGSITISEEGAVQNKGIFVISSTGTLSNEADFTGTGYLQNFGEITVEGEFNPQGQVDNYNIITIEGGEFSTGTGMTNRVGGVIDNSGGFATGNFTNFGTFNNLEDSFLDIAGTIGTFTNDVGSTFDNSGSIDIDPTGEFINIEGLVNNDGADIELAGIITNHVPFTNDGTVKIKFAGQIINLSTITNEGIIILETNTGEIPVIDSTGGTILTNNNEIQNKCGLIVGPFAGTDPLDQCSFTLVILSPSEGDVVTNVNPTTFSGLAQDRDLFGVPDDASENIEWTSSKDGILGTGSNFDFTLTALGNHVITATANDIDDNEFVATVSILVSQVDNDGDGDPVQNDCDDNDPLRFNGNPEVFDGIDNDCNGLVDDTFTNEDGDGFPASADCNDNDATVYPGATELVDGQDNDCDGVLPDNEIDGDGDLHVPGIFDAGGWDGDETIIGGGDCDDSELAIYLGNTEIVDGLDNDCIAGIPENEIDDDLDGYIDGIFDVTLAEFQVNNPLVDGDNDCADNDAARSPGLIEILNDGIDNDCDDATPDGAVDFDGDLYTTADGDCNDNDATVYPGATELVDGQDNDCDGVLPDNEIDQDTDGYIPGTFDPVGGWDGTLQVLGDKDCNDIPIEGFNIHPDAPELPNGIDDNCDGVIPLNEIDEDGDGSFADSDCDDNDPARSPDFEEIVDGIDNDCDTVLPDNEIDNDTDMYIDGIFDLGGWMGTSDVTGDNDCDDTNAAMFPGAEEIPDGFDNDCDGLLLDEEIDNDGDGQAEFQGDCDDDDKFNFLGNDERDDGSDNDCDTEVDEGFDLDGDGYTPIGGGDCDDTNPLVNQNALEILDGLDNDCDGFIDNTTDKYALPEFQANLDEKTIRHYENMAEDLEEEIEDLEYENRKLDKKADKYEAKAEQALEGDSRKAAKYQAKSDRYEDKANEALEDGKERKAAKYQKNSDYFQAKADKALEGNPEKAAKYQAKADNLRAEIASNESLIEMYGKQILVIDMSIGEIPVDWTQTIIVFYPDLSEDAIHDILHDIEDNLKEIEKLEKKAVDYDEKADKAEAKGNQEKADKYRLKATIAREEIEIIEDLNDVLKCAIDFTEDMLAEHGNHGHHGHDDDKGHNNDKGKGHDNYKGKGHDKDNGKGHDKYDD